MRLASLLVLGAILLPLALAAPPRDDSTLTLKSADGKGAITYVTVCRGDFAAIQNGALVQQSPAVELVDDCTASGVYGESNNVQGLQVRAGVDEHGIPYAADTPIVSVQTV